MFYFRRQQSVCHNDGDSDGVWHQPHNIIFSAVNCPKVHCYSYKHVSSPNLPSSIHTSECLASCLHILLLVPWGEDERAETFTSAAPDTELRYNISSPPHPLLLTLANGDRKSWSCVCCALCGADGRYQALVESGDRAGGRKQETLDKSHLLWIIEQMIIIRSLCLYSSKVLFWVKENAGKSDYFFDWYMIDVLWKVIVGYG